MGRETGFVIMKHIIVGTNRKDSKSKVVALFVQKLYLEQGERVEIIDLADLNWSALQHGSYGEISEPSFKKAVEDVLTSEGLIMIVPEYNGSYPGALKYFIDYWKYPDAFLGKPVSFIGLGGVFGGLRPVEHLQQIFSYRNGYLFPERVFLMNVWKLLDQGEIKDPLLLTLMKNQVTGFQKFCRALKS